MKYQALALVVLLTILLAGCAAKQSTPCLANLEPMYGGVDMTEQCKEELIRNRAALDTHGLSSEEAAAQTAASAMGYLEHGDLATAMKRFNQAWLLDPKNCTSFHGFGRIVSQRDHDTDQAIEFYEMGLERCPGNGLLMYDYARLLENANALKGAVSLYEKSVHFTPENSEAYRGLLRCHLQLGNDEAALQAIRRGAPHGLNADRRLVEELERRLRQAR